MQLCFAGEWRRSIRWAVPLRRGAVCVRWQRALDWRRILHALVDLFDKKRKVEISLNEPNLLWGMDILKDRASKPPRSAETVPSYDGFLLPSQS